MDDERYRVADRAAVEAVLDRMAAEIRARLGDGLAVIGIRRRGAPLGEALADRLEARGAAGVRRGAMELKRYDEDLTVLHPGTRLEEPDLPFEVEGIRALLVDDVLYTGRTLLRAAEWLVASGAEAVHAAVLCERAGRETPVAADVVGWTLEIGADGIVEVEIPPFEDDLAVWLDRRPGP